MKEEKDYFESYGMLVPLSNVEETMNIPKVSYHYSPYNNPSNKPKPLIQYEIWIGKYHLGQGSVPPTEPKLVAKITSFDFQVACEKYELITMLNRIKVCEETGEYYSHQSREWFYNWRTNSNSWTGKYYQSKEEALESFKR